MDAIDHGKRLLRKMMKDRGHDPGRLSAANFGADPNTMGCVCKRCGASATVTASPSGGVCTDGRALANPCKS